ncbi:MAG: sigma-E factor negative regulatory protein [Sterolibacterium sp.]
MKNGLSNMLDNELQPDRHQELLTAMRKDGDLRGAMTRYILIGDALRGCENLSSDITGKVMARLASEPTVLAPPAKRPANLFRSAAALAASLTGVAVVAWLAFVPPASQDMPQLAKVAKPQVVATSERMQEYLMAHQAYSPSSSIHGGASYIRTISASR